MGKILFVIISLIWSIDLSRMFYQDWKYRKQEKVNKTKQYKEV